MKNGIMFIISVIFLMSIYSCDPHAESRNAVLQAHKKAQESLNKLYDSIYRTECLMYELCVKPENREICNKYGVVIKNRTPSPQVGKKRGKK